MVGAGEDVGFKSTPQLRGQLVGGVRIGVHKAQVFEPLVLQDQVQVLVFFLD